MKHQPGSAQPSLFDFLMDDPFSESANQPRPKPKPEPVTAKSEAPSKPKPKPRAVPAPVPKPVPPPEAKTVQSKSAKAPNKQEKTSPPPVIRQPEPPLSSIPKKQNSKLVAVPDPTPPPVAPQPQLPVLEPASTSLPRKACPFCKREVLSLAKTTRPVQGIAVECLKCGFRGGVGVNEAEAVAKWDKDGLRNKGARLVQTLERSKKKSEGAK